MIGFMIYLYLFHTYKKRNVYKEIDKISDKVMLISINPILIAHDLV